MPWIIAIGAIGAAGISAYSQSKANQANVASAGEANLLGYQSARESENFSERMTEVERAFQFDEAQRARECWLATP